MQTKFKYLYKTDSDTGYRYVYRILSETDTHMETSVPLFVCWGSTFKRWSKPKLITKKYLQQRKFIPLPQTIADLYDGIKKDDSTEVLFQN